jgi:maltose 6'-phosphate phosphatase
MNRKLLTLNLHCLLAGEPEEILTQVAQQIAQGHYTAFALQEVCQTLQSSPVKGAAAHGWIPSEQEPIRADNQALLLAQKLEALGMCCHWSWSYAHIGYGRFQEGVAVFVMDKAEKAITVQVSAGKDPADWHTRRQLGLCVREDEHDTWFFSCHFSKWSDNDDGFAEEWKRFETAINGLSDVEIYLMGDFNSPSQEPDGGCALVKSKGNWYDSCAGKICDTCPGEIDGWNADQPACRIDYIWKNRPFERVDACTLFDGNAGPVISDHYGLEVVEVDCRAESADCR